MFRPFRGLRIPLLKSLTTEIGVTTQAAGREFGRYGCWKNVNLKPSMGI